MANNNEAFLKRIDLKTKIEILKSIAKHYDCSISDIEEEVLDLEYMDEPHGFKQFQLIFSNNYGTRQQRQAKTGQND